MIRVLIIPFMTLLVGLGFSTGASGPESSRSGSVYSYPEHLTGTFTGGFGEDTCHSCHFDYPLNHKEGTLTLKGFPDQYGTGQTYKIRLQVTRPDLAKAGFQLAARFPDSSQAGRFSFESQRIQLTEAAPDTLQYLQHTSPGTEITGDKSAVWELSWTAPGSTSSDQDTVYIHLAANAANGDASEFGDFIMTRELQLLPAEK